ncbi:MAG: prepilin-type N-terminal cleavage/methylation domain-containing protein [Patescibacteria group bacterium]
MIKNLKFQQGFTIMEVLAVIFIISFGLLGVMSLVNQNVQVGYINHNNIIASQLCQESLELCRNIRDNNWLAGNNWKTGINSATNIIQDGTYAIDYMGITNVTNINDPLAKLYIDSNSFYRHLVTPGTAITTAFSRTITVKTETAASTTLECAVQWQTGQNIHHFITQTVLYDWR